MSCIIRTLGLLPLIAAMLIGETAQAADGEALVRQQQCIACHAIKEMEPRIGPPFPAVALRYAKADDAQVQRLASKIVNGGAGAWGTVPMIKHPQLSNADAQAMVRYVLSLAPAENTADKSNKKSSN